MKTTSISGAAAPRNNAQKEAVSPLTCSWSVGVAPQGANVGIKVHSESDIHVTTAIINIYQWYDNSRHPVEAFKVDFVNKRDANFTWSAKAAKGSEPEKGPLYFEAMVGSSQGSSGALHLSGKVAAQPDPQFQKQRQTDKYETVVQRKGMPKIF
jgi:hypothetical protein